MESVYIRSYKISLKLPIDKIQVFFNLNKTQYWKEYIILENSHLNKILKYNMESKTVYLFKYGCICLVNFNENEIYTLLKYLDSIIGSVDYYLFSNFNENHTEMIDKVKYVSSNTDHINTICIILAKSVELSKLEADLEGLLDKAKKLINNLQTGKLHINKKLAFTVSEILRLEYHYANNIKIFERNIYNNENSESRIYFDKIYKHYELEERINIIQSKMDDMRNIIKQYSFFSYRKRESKAYWFEVALLSLFPMSYILDIVPYKKIISRILSAIFR